MEPLTNQKDHEFIKLKKDFSSCHITHKNVATWVLIIYSERLLDLKRRFQQHEKNEKEIPQIEKANHYQNLMLGSHS